MKPVPGEQFHPAGTWSDDCVVRQSHSILQNDQGSFGASFPFSHPPRNSQRSFRSRPFGVLSGKRTIHTANKAVQAAHAVQSSRCQRLRVASATFISFFITDSQHHPWKSRSPLSSLWSCRTYSIVSSSLSCYPCLFLQELFIPLHGLNMYVPHCRHLFVCHFCPMSLCCAAGPHILNHSV